MGEARRSESAFERAVSASVGYVIGPFVVVPFDRVKTLIQVAPAPLPKAHAVARDLFAREGFRGLYRGVDTQLLRAPYSVIYFSLYDELLRMQGDKPLAPLNAAVLARGFEVSLRSPLELLHTRLQAAQGKVTLAELVREQFRQPLHSWWRGYTLTLMRDVPFSAIYWVTYEEAKRRARIPEIANPALKTFVHGFCCGGGAGAIAALVTMPVDVIKSRRQKLLGHHASGCQTSAISCSYSDILRFIASNPQMSLAGVGPRLLRVPLGLATMMAGIETTRWTFRRQRESCPDWICKRCRRSTCQEGFRQNYWTQLKEQTLKLHAAKLSNAG